MRIVSFLLGAVLLNLSSCKTVGRENGHLASEASSDRSQEIYQSVLSALKRTNADTQGSLWGEGSGKLKSNWVMQSPENYWGRSAEELPINLTCSPGSAGCDDVFSRRLCSTDDDCQSTKSSCKVLEASRTPQREARKMCLGSGDSLLDRYYALITSTERNLDITTLSYPTGTFKPMLENALAMLAAKSKPISVRLLVSGHSVTQINVFQDVSKLGATIVGEIEKTLGRKIDKNLFRFNYGYFSKTQVRTELPGAFPTWNHSKIVIVDQSRMIEGGHNMWDPDYTRDNPVFDISMEVEGPIVQVSQAFVNSLWNRIPYQYSTSGEKFKNPSSITSEPGPYPMIGVGRLDFFDNNAFENLGNKKGKNPGDDAIKALIRSAKYNLKFSVQDFFQTIFGEKGARIYVNNPWMADALTEAILKGVKVQVVQSDDTPVPNTYVMLKPVDTLPRLVSLIEEKAKTLPKADLGGKSLREFICDHIEYAPWRFKSGVKKWANGAEIAGHTKLVMADDSAFYMGSQNMYPAGLQEYGLIVANADLTRELQDQHWNQLWNESKGERIPCR